MIRHRISVSKPMSRPTESREVQRTEEETVLSLNISIPIQQSDVVAELNCMG